MVGVAVNVTAWFLHTAPVRFGLTLTKAVTEVVTVIVNDVDVAVAGDAHDMPDVITTVITSPFFKLNEL